MGVRKLYIDIPALLESGTSADQIECSYFYHRKNKGQFSLLEIAEFAVYCRQCQDAFCVAACPKEALEHQANGVIRRFNLRCVGCKSCVLACPFGTIFPEVINYVTAKCDYCLNQLNEDVNFIPACVRTAPKGTFSIIEIESENPKEHIYFAGEHLALKSHSWLKKEGRI
ncbi:MAG: 4Fe-4S dicluster domain-containing protein [Ignavibacteriales bacterium]